MNEQQTAYVIAKLSKLEGELLATQAALRAVLLTHPERDEAIAAVHRQFEKFVSIGLNTAVSEDLLAGFQRGRGIVLPSARDLSEDDTL